ncbi:hypothetical protein [Streptococcus zalophi]|uniref:hypothetical protein n=1 Tax=Streptococcus zalophi TaxID=640031 RepID=UPI00215CD9ED|nr:hypothetical protein [Streptococcus zalophi]MCR8967855.1 hypothetical protein [Streptococcus zalophi]
MEIIKDKKTIIISAILLLLTILLFTRVGSSHQIQDLNQKTIASLDDKKEKVMLLAATSTAASTAITLIPGDVGMPLAENLADVSDYLLVVIGAIWLQKYLIAIAGMVSFKFFLPVACLGVIAYLFTHKKIFLELTYKLALFGLLLFAIVPASVAVSNHIETTFQASIQQTIEQTQKENEKIDKELEKGKDSNWLSGIVDTVTGETSKVINNMENSLSNMIDAVAVFIVTTCVIPVLVLMSFIWIINLIFGLSLNTDIRQFSFIGKKIRNRRKVSSQS